MKDNHKYIEGPTEKNKVYGVYCKFIQIGTKTNSDATYIKHAHNKSKCIFMQCNTFILFFVQMHTSQWPKGSPLWRGFLLPAFVRAWIMFLSKNFMRGVPRLLWGAAASCKWSK
jgi:hypothetical protein